MTFGKSKKKNILFIVSDDLRPEINVFLQPDFPSPLHRTKIHSPNLDALAAKSALFKKAYVQQSLCSPSRTSFLTSRRPDTTRIYEIGPYWREEGGNFTTIPQFFKENGYITKGFGKIFHTSHRWGNDDAYSWSEPYTNMECHEIYENDKNSWTAVNKSTYEEYPLPDQQMLSFARDSLQSLAIKSKQGQPFFLGLGIRRPHLPFQFPEEFLSLYPMSDVYLPPNGYIPQGMPELAWSVCGQLLQSADVKNVTPNFFYNSSLPDWKIRELRRAYYATVSYIDSLIGQVMAELEQQGLAEETIVSFVGDHGWELGE